MMLLESSKFDFKWRHLHIKPISDNDLQLYLDLYCSQRVMRFIGEVLTEEEAIVSFRHALSYNTQPEGNRLFLTVKHSEDISPAGIVSISNLDRGNNIAELGSILAPSYHGRFIGKESVIALMQHIARTLGVDHFLLDISPKNLPALRAARIMGFKPVLQSETLYELK